MSYTYSFFDNQVIGVDHLNNVISTLISHGVEQNITIPTTVNDLNDIVKTAIENGGMLGTKNTFLSVSKDGSSLNISAGTAIFSNGTFVTVDNSGEKIPYTAGVLNYVYAVSSMSENKVYFKAYNEEQTEDENTKFLLLAVVDAEGTVTDKRTYARGKSANFYYDFSYQGRIEKEDTVEFAYKDGVSELNKEYVIDGSAKSVIVEAQEDTYTDSTKTWSSDAWFYVHYGIKDKKIICDCGRYLNDSDVVGYLSNGYGYGKTRMHVSFDTDSDYTKLTLNFKKTNANAGCVWQYKLIILP